MKKLLVWLLVLGGLGYGGWWAWQRFMAQDAERVVRERVKVMLSEHEDNEQASVSMWAEGKFMSDYDSLKAFSDEYTTFWQESGLGEAKTWKIREIEMAPDGRSALVTVASGSREIVLHVERGVPISVVD